MFNFEKLDVWRIAVEYADEIYLVTQRFPADERFGLTNQLRQASVSISSNIAEGSGRRSNRDFIRFIQIAYASLMETISQPAIAHRRAFIDDTGHQALYTLAERVAKMLSRLRQSLEREVS